MIGSRNLRDRRGHRSRRRGRGSARRRLDPQAHGRRRDVVRPSVQSGDRGHGDDRGRAQNADAAPDPRSVMEFLLPAVAHLPPELDPDERTPPGRYASRYLAQVSCNGVTVGATGRRGGLPRYSDVVIEAAMALRIVFHLRWRQTEGLLASIVALMGAGPRGAGTHDVVEAGSNATALASGLPRTSIRQADSFPECAVRSDKGP